MVGAVDVSGALEDVVSVLAVGDGDADVGVDGSVDVPASVGDDEPAAVVVGEPVGPADPAVVVAGDPDVGPADDGPAPVLAGGRESQV